MNLIALVALLPPTRQSPTHLPSASLVAHSGWPVSFFNQPIFAIAHAAALFNPLGSEFHPRSLHPLLGRPQRLNPFTTFFNRALSLGWVSAHLHLHTGHVFTLLGPTGATIVDRLFQSSPQVMHTACRQGYLINTVNLHLNPAMVRIRTVRSPVDRCISDIPICLPGQPVDRHLVRFAPSQRRYPLTCFFFRCSNFPYVVGYFTTDSPNVGILDAPSICRSRPNPPPPLASDHSRLACTFQVPSVDVKGSR